jgi:diaminohydroxyphosphoribosylaminopyrimidine deaminase / 5-amino-6-(5-phosphoribosylamino)uracil reductase
MTSVASVLNDSGIDFELHMRRAISLATRVLTTTPNPRVGCVIVNAANEVLGEGWHRAPGSPHAEVNALLDAGGRARGSIAFVTLEPCAHFGRTPPCADALIDAGVKTVVLASLDPFPQVAGKGMQKLQAAGIEVIHLKEFDSRAKAVNAGYFKRLTRGLPFLRCKLAMSLDGRTAAANGESRWISGPEARAEVQRLRAGSCAIVTGINTVLSDDPSLSLRSAELAMDEEELQENSFALQRQPIRVICDSRLRTPCDAKILQLPGRVKIMTTQVTADFPDNVDVVSLPAVEAGVDPRAVLESLASTGEINEVLLEAGPTLSGAFLQAGLVDELIVYVAEKLLGDRGLPLFRLPGLEAIAHQLQLGFRDVRRVGNDVRIIASIKKK